MDSADFPRLVYLVILLTAVVGWLMAENRQSLGRTARSLLVWGLIVVGLMAGYGLWGDIRNDIAPRQTVLEDGTGVAVPRSEDGHFHLTLEVNGVPVEFLVDTGASDIVLTMRDAERVGLEPGGLAFLGRARTANGMVETAYTTVDRISLGPIRFDRVGVAVNGGEMDGSLLGMAFLNRFGRLEISDNTLLLEP
ncbi:MAG: TIGR02281 family clan AA aspartic protease [Silicimonas sp.]